MGRYTPQYTPEQERAVAGAMLGDYGRPMTARQACEAAEQGRLGLPSYAVKLKTAYVIRDRVEQQRSPAKPAREMTLEDRAQTLLEARMTKLERDARKGNPDVHELRTVVRAIAELRRSQRTISSRPTAEPAEPEEPEPTKPEQPSYYARFIPEQKAGQTQDDEGNAGSDVYPPRPDDETEDEQDAMPVRSDAGE